MSSRLEDILMEVGNTPIVPVISMLDKEKTVYLKLENKNPSGTIKDRLAKYIILNNPDASGFVDTSIGNFAVSMSWFASLSDKKAFFLLYENINKEVVNKIRNFGGEIIYVNTEYFDRLSNQARIYAEQYGYLYCGQFKSHKFDEFYKNDIALEIKNQLPNVNKIVMIRGTGGIINGLMSSFADMNVQFYEPNITSNKFEVNTINKIEINANMINIDVDLIDKVQKYLIQRYGIKSGYAGAINTATAMQLAQSFNNKEVILTFVTDSI